MFSITLLMMWLLSFSALSWSMPTKVSVNETLVARGGAADAILDLGEDIIEGIFNGIAQDKADRSQFTQQAVAALHDKDSTFNYVIVHTKHEINFAGTQGQDWSHMHKEFDIKIGGTIGYEIYSFHAGTFTLEGDGGYLNWAYYGNVVSDQPGKTPRAVVFSA